MGSTFFVEHFPFVYDHWLGGMYITRRELKGDEQHGNKKYVLYRY
jgi:hypothetical protein